MRPTFQEISCRDIQHVRKVRNDDSLHSDDRPATPQFIWCEVMLYEKVAATAAQSLYWMFNHLEEGNRFSLVCAWCKHSEFYIALQRLVSHTIEDKSSTGWANKLKNGIGQYLLREKPCIFSQACQEWKSDVIWLHAAWMKCSYINAPSRKDYFE